LCCISGSINLISPSLKIFFQLVQDSPGSNKATIFVVVSSTLQSCH
jgi:hypothetical protein